MLSKILDLFKKKEAPKAPVVVPLVHNYIDEDRRWGHDISYTPKQNGMTGRIRGWSDMPIKVGDFILMTGRNGATARYRVTKIGFENDPRDLFFGDVEFYPRNEKERGQDDMNMKVLQWWSAR